MVEEEDVAYRSDLTFDDYDSYDYYFRYFRNINDFVNTGKEYERRLLDRNNKSDTAKRFRKEYGSNAYYDPGFVGTNRRQAEDEGPFFKRYIEERALENSIQAFDEILAEIDMGGAFKKAKLVTTEKSTGIFDFGLASPGLYPLQEFYSKLLSEKHPLEFPQEIPGIVPPIYVDKNEMGDFWYTSKSNEKFEMTKQQKGTEAVRLKLPDAKLEYATSVKKVYVTFKREGGKANFVDLYVGCGGWANMDSSGMLARALPVMMAARYFEMMGIRTRINASRVYSRGSHMVCVAWTIKDYGSDLDFKRIALDTSDSRFFRWNMWKWVCATMAYEHNKWTPGQGATIFRPPELTAVATRWRNWYFEKMKENKVPFVNLKPELMMFGGLEVPPNSYTYSGPTGDTFRAIKDSFLQILDTVDFSFNKPQDAVQRIYQRQVVRDGKSVASMKKYVRKVLVNANRYPTRGQYATPKDVQTELYESYKQSLSDFSKYMSQIA